jgi:hypothetical protein
MLTYKDIRKQEKLVTHISKLKKHLVSPFFIIGAWPDSVFKSVESPKKKTHKSNTN